jgi:hypothetical protein
METELPFLTLRPWLRTTFGRDVYRVALDAGSTCPNRDGSKGFGGCVYCDVEGSGTGALRTGVELAAQLESGLKRIARREDGCAAIAYFQSYSNTYVEIERLREVLAVVDPHVGAAAPGTGVGGPPIVAVSLATRPDTLSDQALEVLAQLAQRVPVWVELGLEAADDQVLEDIRRFHTVADFEAAVRRCHEAGLLVVGHAILGLPGDGRDGARRTAEALARSGVEGVKVHNLLVLKRTQLEVSWRAGELELLDATTYVDWLADFVERLHPEQVLHRLTADAPDEEKLAPYWDVAKNQVKRLLAEELAQRGTRQGSFLESPS